MKSFMWWKEGLWGLLGWKEVWRMLVLKYFEAGLLSLVLLRFCIPFLSSLIITLGSFTSRTFESWRENTDIKTGALTSKSLAVNFFCLSLLFSFYNLSNGRFKLDIKFDLYV